MLAITPLLFSKPPLPARWAGAAAALLVLASMAPGARANVNIVFDYHYDTSSFFDDSKRKLLDAAALTFEARLTDNLTAIASDANGSFSASFFHPSDPNTTVTLNNFSVASQELRIYIGAGNLGGALGLGGPGAYSAFATTQAYLDNAASRGQPGALLEVETDFGPWGGAIGFNTTANWYFDNDIRTTESFPGFDFYSVALHEIGHVLGVGAADSWRNRITGTTFNGTAQGAGVRALTSDGGHWTVGTKGELGPNAPDAAMTPSIGAGTRKHFTSLDYGGLHDIGWQVSAVPEPATWALWGAGGLLMAGLRRRSNRRMARAV